MRAAVSDRSKWLPPPIERQRSQSQPAGQLAAADVLLALGEVGEHGGKEGIAGGGAARRDGPDDVVERDFLVGEGVQDDGADVAQVAGEVGAGVNADAQGDGVDEESDEPGGVGVGAAGDQGADGEVALAGVPGQEQAPDGEQGDEVGASGCAGGGEPVQLAGGHGDSGPVAGEVGALGRGVVRDGADRAGAVERLPPVGQVVVGATREQVAVPGGVVDVLDRRVAKPGGDLVTTSGVQRPQFPLEYLKRPFVYDRMMGGKQEQVSGRAGVPGPYPQQRPGRQVE